MAEEDEYDVVARNKLKLKSEAGIKKKKKKKKDKKLLKQISHTLQSEEVEKPAPKQTKTKAELAYQQQQEKMKMQRILEKASMTHKERVEKFNQHLDSLTEHFDIPKVSWTK